MSPFCFSCYNHKRLLLKLLESLVVPLVRYSGQWQGGQYSNTSYSVLARQWQGDQYSNTSYSCFFPPFSKCLPVSDSVSFALHQPSSLYDDTTQSHKQIFAKNNKQFECAVQINKHTHGRLQKRN